MKIKVLWPTDPKINSLEYKSKKDALWLMFKTLLSLGLHSCWIKIQISWVDLIIFCSFFGLEGHYTGHIKNVIQELLKPLNF